MIAVPPITLNAWLDDGSIEWIKRAFPSEIEDILLTDEFDANDYEYGGECESDDEERLD